MNQTVAVDRGVGLPVGLFFPMTRGCGSISRLVFAERLKPQRPTLTSHPCAWRIGHKDTLRAFASNLTHL